MDTLVIIIHKSIISSNSIFGTIQYLGIYYDDY